MLVKVRKALVDICRVEGVQCIKRLTSTESTITYEVQAILDDSQIVQLDLITADEIDEVLEEILNIINQHKDDCTYVIL